MFDAQGQGRIFLIMSLCGVAIGLLYSFFYILRFCFRFKRATEIIFDLLFSASAILLLLGFIHRFCGGEMRLYIFLGAITGFLLCYLSYFKILAKCAQLVYNMLIKLYRALKKTKVFSKLLK